MSFTSTSYILICIGHNRLLWIWSINIAWWISTIKTSPVIGQSYATATETVWQLGVMISFEGSYPTIFTGQLKFCTISACWPMTQVSEWLSISVHCSTSYVRTALTRMVLTTEVTNNSQIILCLVNSGLLLLVVGGGCSWCPYYWCHDSHQCGYLIHQIAGHITPFKLNLLLCRLVSPGLSLLVECCFLVKRKHLIFLLGIVHIFNRSSTAALKFFCPPTLWLYDSTPEISNSVGEALLI